VPLQRQSGLPLASWATINPTNGWPLPSNSPSVIAPTGKAAKAAIAITENKAKSIFLRMRFISLWKDMNSLEIDRTFEKFVVPPRPNK
jgi:hypothetical protein